MFGFSPPYGLGHPFHFGSKGTNNLLYIQGICNKLSSSKQFVPPITQEWGSRISLQLACVNNFCDMKLVLLIELSCHLRELLTMSTLNINTIQRKIVVNHFVTHKIDDRLLWKLPVITDIDDWVADVLFVPFPICMEIRTILVTVNDIKAWHRQFIVKELLITVVEIILYVLYVYYHLSLGFNKMVLPSLE